MAAALVVSACAGLPPVEIPLEGVPSAFEMRGRLSVAHGGRGEILRLRWQHAPDADDWVIATPMGTEMARIERRAGDFTVHRPDAAPMAAGSFAELTEHLLGAYLDERLLLAWLHARPLSGPSGWTVTVDESRRFGETQVARRLTALREDTVLKLVVDDYRARPH